MQLGRRASPPSFLRNDGFIGSGGSVLVWVRNSEGRPQRVKIGSPPPCGGRGSLGFPASLSLFINDPGEFPSLKSQMILGSETLGTTVGRNDKLIPKLEGWIYIWAANKGT